MKDYKEIFIQKDAQLVEMIFKHCSKGILKLI